MPAGRVVGVDPSTVMSEQASRRNRAALDAGRVELNVAAAEHLPFDDASFDKALSMHSLSHWSAPAQGLREVRRVLKPDGTLLIALRRQHSKEIVEATLAGAGFALQRTQEGTGKQDASTLFVATRGG